MTKLRSIAVVAVLGVALFAPQAQAEEGGWNTQYGMLFSLNNPFTATGLLSPANEGTVVDGGVGLQYNLGPQTAVRVVLDIGRTTNPQYEETDWSTGVAEVNDVVPLQTSSFDIGIGASYLMRLTTGSIAPYVGGGAGIFWNSYGRSGTVDDTAGAIQVYDSSHRTMGLGLVGQIGLEWRVHKAVAIFAEYGLNVTAFESISDENKDTLNGAPTSDNASWTQTKIFAFDTALNQGGSLGLVAFF